MKQKTLTIKAADGASNRRFKCVMSAEVVDRDGEVVLLDGLDLTQFQTNPVMLFDHGLDKKQGKLPVGKVVEVERKDGELTAVCELLDRPESHPEGAEWLPDTLLHLIEQKCLNTVSIGFIPLDGRRPTSDDFKAYGKDCQVVTTKSELCELSIVAVPANQAALISAVSKGLLPKSSKAYLAPTAPEKVSVAVEIAVKRQKHTIPVRITSKSSMRDLVMVRLKGGLYA